MNFAPVVWMNVNKSMRFVNHLYHIEHDWMSNIRQTLEICRMELDIAGRMYFQDNLFNPVHYIYKFRKYAKLVAFNIHL